MLTSQQTARQLWQWGTPRTMTKYVKGALFGVAALALLIVGAGTALVGQRLYRNYTGLKANNAVLNQQLAEYAALIENQKATIAQLGSTVPVFSRLNVRQLSIDDDSILRAYDRDGFPDSALESFDKFHEYVSGLYIAAEPAIAQRWGLQSRKLRRVLFSPRQWERFLSTATERNRTCQGALLPTN